MNTIIGFNVFRFISGEKVFIDSFPSKVEALRYCRSHPITNVSLCCSDDTGYFIIPVISQVGQLDLFEDSFT